MSATTTVCENHICGNTFDAKKDICHTCSLCAEPLYCSEKCRIMDWHLHDCRNAISSSLPVALPYHYEDEMVSEDLSQVGMSDPIFASYKIRDATPNRKIKETTVHALVSENYVASPDVKYRGVKPAKDLMQQNYTMAIEIGSKKDKVKGTIPFNMIYKENPSNDIARKLSATRSTSGFRAAPDQTIFWPQGVNVDSNLNDTFKIQLYLGSKTVPQISIAGQYNLLRNPAQVSRHVEANMNANLKPKFPAAAARRNLQIRSYDDGKNAALLTFDVDAKNNCAKLVDVELYHTVNEQARPLDKRQTVEHHMYSCDAKSFASVIGLAMTVEEMLAEVPFMGEPVDSSRLERIENANAIIKEYAYALHENGGIIPSPVPDHVHAAINAAVESLYEPIGLQFGVDYWRKKASGPYAKVHDEVVRLVKRSNAARRKWNDAHDARTAEGATRGQRAKAWFQEKAAAVQKSLLLRSLQHFSIALNEVINTKINDQVPLENLSRYASLIKILTQAQQTIVTDEELDQLNTITGPAAAVAPPAVPPRDDESSGSGSDEESAE